MQLQFQATGHDGYERIIADHPSLTYIREFGILRLRDGRTFESNTGSCEALLHIIEGSCMLVAGEETYENVGARPSPFDGRPTAIYLPPDTAYTIAGSELEMAITLAAADGGGDPALIAPDTLSPASVGQDNWQRTVTMIAPPEFASQRLILGETVNPPGNWSGVPTHKHDTRRPGLESLQEELYYFRAHHPAGWGVERIYDKNGLDELCLLQDRVVTIMPRGFHTLTAAPGFALYYAFVLAGPDKNVVPFVDPDQAWIAS